MRGKSNLNSEMRIPEGTFADYNKERSQSLIRSNSNNLLDSFGFYHNVPSGNVTLRDVCGRSVSTSINENVLAVLNANNPNMSESDLVNSYLHLPFVEKAFVEFNYRPTVMMVVVDFDENFLILESKKKDNQSSWHFPQGGIDVLEATWEGERLEITKFEDLLSAGKRELSQETGIELEDGSFAFFVSDYLKKAEYKVGRLSKSDEIAGRDVVYAFGKQYHICGIRTERLEAVEVDGQEISSFDYVPFEELGARGISDWKIEAARDLFGR